MKNRKKEYKKISDQECNNGHNCPPPLNGRVSVLEAKVDIIFSQIRAIDKRVWIILVTIIIGILSTIMIQMF